MKTHGGFVYCAEMNTIDTHPDRAKKGGLLYVCTMYSSAGPEVFTIVTAREAPLQFKPCPTFCPLFQTNSKQYPFYTPSATCIGVET